jgi:hypothetical protein
MYCVVAACCGGEVSADARQGCRSSISSAGAKDIIKPALIHFPLSHKADNQHESCNKGQFTSNRFMRRTLVSYALRMGIPIMCLLVCLQQTAGS